MRQIGSLLIFITIGLLVFPEQPLSAKGSIDDDLRIERETSNTATSTTAHPELTIAESANSDNGVSGQIQVSPQATPIEDGGEGYDEYVERLCRQAAETDRCKYELTKLEVERLKAAKQYQVWVYNHPRVMFLLRLIFDIVNFVVVMLVVGTGLYLSYLECKKEETPEAKLSLAKGCVEIDSNVIGLVILVVSLVFLYLYIINVRPTNIINNDVDVNDQPSLSESLNFVLPPNS